MRTPTPYSYPQATLFAHSDIAMAPWLRGRLRQYAVVGKARLSALVAVTALAGYAVGHTVNERRTGKRKPLAFAMAAGTSAGVFLASMSASTLNQVIEVHHDARMARTSSRPLPTRALSVRSALCFAAGTSAASAAVLCASGGVLPAALALANTALYAFVYTPLKRVTTLNTAAGAVVGAVPPTIGVLAACGTVPGALSAAVALSSVLYCWQFPHFCALSFRLRSEYARAGFCMAASLNPVRAMRAAALHSALIFPASASLLEGCDGPWHLAALGINGALALASLRLATTASDRSARLLFHISLLHLPLLLAIVVVARMRSSAETPAAVPHII